ncbi:degenerin mec-4 isoform X2 [Nematostella vectensis]|uniref:degenerin mec-4 isoform X2 n=1 Tax=Nematostella vectensis TaxID=45351 RepID=UPI0020777ABE|nr:degenerin mec-4 isoform X2 [Nematostella vectensis]
MTESPTSVRGLVRDFSDRTSCHGIGQINAPQPFIWRVFWLLIFLGGLGMVFYQCQSLLVLYLDKPTATTVDVTYSPTLNFPAVTICNLNAMKKDSLSAFPEAEGLLKRYNEMSQSNGTFDVLYLLGDDELQDLAKGYIAKNEETANISIDTQLILEDLMVHTLAKSDQQKLERAGHRFEELVFRCSWNMFTCNKGEFMKYWRSFWHFRYGNCYTFNQGLDKEGEEIIPLKSSNTGPMYGLTLDLYINQNQYITPFTQEAGVKVLLSDQSEITFPDSDGFSVPPGYSAFIGLRKRLITRVDPFKNGSCYNTDKGLEMGSIYQSAHRGMKYSIQGCMNSCLANKQRENCNCTEAKFRVGPNCKNATEMECLHNVSLHYLKGQLGCLKRCPQPCTKDFLRLNIYFQDLNLEKITYKEAYPAESFLGDVGGQLGLWIGVSVITCAEFVKLMMDVVWVVMQKMKRRSNKVQRVDKGREG